MERFKSSVAGLAGPILEGTGPPNPHKAILMPIRSFFLIVFSLALLALAGIPSLAQSGSGDITGEVRDASGGLIAGAKVTLVRVETQETYSTVSTEGGVYSFASLKPGGYTVTAEAPGFKK